MHKLLIRLVLRHAPQMPFYDMIIVGAGPAGLARAVYGASEGLHTLLLKEKLQEVKLV